MVGSYRGEVGGGGKFRSVLGPIQGRLSSDNCTKSVPIDTTIS